MTTDETIKITGQYVLKTYGRKPFAFENGKGVLMYNLEGEEYLDFNSGLGVNALGHCHPVVSNIIKNQAEKIIHTSNLYHISSQAALAEKICKHCFGERVFFCNSGTEAVEGALKFARKWGNTQEKPKTEVVAFKNSFHGRTFGALSATMQEKYRKGFEPLLDGFAEAIFNDTASVDNMVTDKTAAIIIEPLQGEGGVNFATRSFIKYIENVCKEREVLLIVDEVQCGMGRTGKLFAYEHFGITPDIMTLAKPIAGGLPIGAVVTGPRVWPVINPGEHASTFGGNHFVTGVACGVFDILSDSQFLKDVEEKGEYLAARLGEIAKKFDSIKEVRGKGLLMAVAVDFNASDAVEYFERQHILICTAGPSVIRFIPPLIVTRDDIDRVVETLERFLSER
ncbi:MAG: aspartate aminotransferase family protein [Candidatus Latescibacteria bacterium]|nr:aspartate aminotransferase family protein [Candidatus Latescibacterota bacterium]